MLNVLVGKALATVMVASAPTAFGLQVSPVHVDARAGGSAVVTVRDVGTKRLTVHTSLLDVHKSPAGQCGVTPAGLPRGITITPAVLRLRPGHSKTAVVHVASSVPASDVAVIFATVDGTRASVEVTGAVGVQLLISTSGKTVAHRCESLPPVKTTGLRTQTLEAAGGSALVLVGLGAWWTLRRRRTDPDGEGGSQTMT